MKRADFLFIIDYGMAEHEVLIESKGIVDAWKEFLPLVGTTIPIYDGGEDGCGGTIKSIRVEYLG